MHIASFTTLAFYTSIKPSDFTIIMHFFSYTLGLSVKVCLYNNDDVRVKTPGQDTPIS